MTKTTIPTAILAELSAATFEGNEMRLRGALDRGVYQKVAKIVEAAGGKWNRKAAAHVFPGDAAEAMETILLTGEIMRPQDLGQFDSPPAVVELLMERAGIDAGMSVLEPSAGLGNIIEAVLKFSPSVVRAVELDPMRRRDLRTAFGGDARVRVADKGDFLSIDPNKLVYPFDRVIMNPPFAKQADIAHVTHAMGFLKPGGRLVSVMSAGVKFRQDRKAVAFRDLLIERHAIIEPLPDKSFKVSGTTVNTVVVVMDKP